ncbi:MAG: hydrogenase [Candidatus Omnitrophica bacterium]|nr:hydrogenase [Candidatus Omnitrophota bacterium]MDE2008610.1 hydrogenase [Candidatus Omnitrophota bacterium]MDE2214076.1 hydrogenase [Candidatus Omnitrophota bacterium]MDE2230946.1 hydrogenase [Candidatus Omnitrophota bacterium]
MWLDISLIVIILSGIVLLGSSRIGTIIQLFAFQSLVLSSIPLQVDRAGLNWHVLTIAFGTLIVKVFVMPNFLFWAIRHVRLRREAPTILGYGKTMLLGGILVGMAFYISSKLTLPDRYFSRLFIPAAFSIFAIGLLLLVSRVKAITQVIGYLVMENGIFLFSMLLLDKTPFLIEMGILLDIFVAVLVMSIVINNITEDYEDTNTLNLTTLRD